MYMRIFKTLIVTFLLVLPAAFTSAGTEGEGQFEINPYAGWNFIENCCPEIDDSVVYGLRFGYGFNNAWGLEMEANWTPTNWDSTDWESAGMKDWDVDIINFRGSLLYNFRNASERVTPYLKGGIGWMDMSVEKAGSDWMDMIAEKEGVEWMDAVFGDEGIDGNETDFAYHGGFGIRWKPSSSEAWALRFEALGVFTCENCYTVEVTAGVSWFFGGEKASPPTPAPAPTPAPKPVPAPVPVSKPASIVVPPLEVGEAMVLEGVYFDSDKFNIDTEDAAVLDEWVLYLKRNPKVRIRVIGHTDSDNTDSYNQKLSMRRSNAVSSYLQSKGIEASRLDVQGFGEDKPISTNLTKEGKAFNRRTMAKPSAVVIRIE